MSPRLDTKRPLFRALAPAPAFPVEALGELRAAAEAIHECTRAPVAICCQSVLAAATLAIQAHRDVELPGAGRRPLTGIFVSVAESGERKSAVDRLALRPVWQIEERFRQDHAAERETYANDKGAWEAARTNAKKVGKSDRAAIARALATIGPEPKPPPSPMVLVADPTPEALVLHLAESRPWCGLFTDEGGVLVGGAAFNDESRMRTGALLNILWDGGPIRRLRVLTGRAFLPGRRCSVHVMMQPVVSSRFFGDDTLGGIGTLARTLLVAPESVAGTRIYREPPASAAPILDAYTVRLLDFLARPPRTKPDEPDVLDPEAMGLHPDGHRMWIELHDQVERELRPESRLAPVRAFASKLAEHAGRLAAVLTVYADPEAIEVTADAMACGTLLAQHYAAEMLRLHDAAAVAPELAVASRLLAWWQAQPDPVVHLAAIYQNGPNALRTATAARKAVDVLEEHRWVRRLVPGAVVDGKVRKEAWELLP